MRPTLMHDGECLSPAGWDYTTMTNSDPISDRSGCDMRNGCQMVCTAMAVARELGTCPDCTLHARNANTAVAGHNHLTPACMCVLTAHTGISRLPVPPAALCNAQSAHHQTLHNGKHPCQRTQYALHTLSAGLVSSDLDKNMPCTTLPPALTTTDHSSSWCDCFFQPRAAENRSQSHISVLGKSTCISVDMSAAFGLKQATKPCITEPVTQHEHGAIPPSAHARRAAQSQMPHTHTYTCIHLRQSGGHTE